MKCTGIRLAGLLTGAETDGGLPALTGVQVQARLRRRKKKHSEPTLLSRGAVQSGPTAAAGS